MNKRHASVFILLPTVLGIAGAMTINKYTAVGALSVALATVLTYLVPIKSPGLLVKHKPSVMGSMLSLYASMAVLLVLGEALTDGLLGCVRLILMASWLDFVLNASVAINDPHSIKPESTTRGEHIAGMAQVAAAMATFVGSACYGLSSGHAAIGIAGLSIAASMAAMLIVTCKKGKSWRTAVAITAHMAHADFIIIIIMAVICCFFDGDDKADAVALQTLVPLVALLLLDAFKTALHDSKAKGSTAC